MPRTLLLLFRWAVFALACWFMLRQWRAYEVTQVFHWLPDQGRMHTHWDFLLLAIALLVPVNWGLESVKWRWMLRDLERLSPWRSLAAVLAGSSISLVTPNRTGEFVGRVLFLEPKVRIDAAILTVLANLSQLLVTLVAGTSALLVWWLLDGPLPLASAWEWGLLIGSAAIVSFGAGWLFLHPAALHRLLHAWPALVRFEAHFIALDGLPRRRLWAVQALSLARYAVFVVQFVLLLVALGAGVPAGPALLAVPIVFLLTTLAPTVMFTELGVRASAALLVLGPMGGDALTVPLTSSLLWSLNVLLPALVGSVILLFVRIGLARTMA